MGITTTEGNPVVTNHNCSFIKEKRKYSMHQEPSITIIADIIESNTVGKVQAIEI